MNYLVLLIIIVGLVVNFILISAINSSKIEKKELIFIYILASIPYLLFLFVIIGILIHNIKKEKV